MSKITKQTQAVKSETLMISMGFEFFSSSLKGENEANFKARWGRRPILPPSFSKCVNPIPAWNTEPDDSKCQVKNEGMGGVFGPVSHKSSKIDKTDGCQKSTDRCPKRRPVGPSGSQQAVPGVKP